MTIDRPRLPSAKRFYELQFSRLSRPNRTGWCAADCPFHRSKSHKSFSVNVVTGAFHCFAKGDLIKFVMLLGHLDFKNACELLGAWQEGNKRTPKPLRRSVPLLMEFTMDRVQYRTEIVDEPRNDLPLLRRIHSDAGDRLHELHQGIAETFEGEEEIQWSILAASWELVHMELGHARQEER